MVYLQCGAVDYCSVRASFLCGEGAGSLFL